MQDRIMNEVSLDASRTVLASVGEGVEEEYRPLLYAVVAQAVKHALENYEVRMSWHRKRHIATEALP